MRLQELVAASNAVADVSGRLEKTAKLADLLKRLQPDEIVVGVAFLSGSLRQGRVGLGWASIARARSGPAADAPSLDIREIDAAFERIAGIAGAGSAKRREAQLADVFR